MRKSVVVFKKTNNTIVYNKLIYLLSIIKYKKINNDKVEKHHEGRSTAQLVTVEAFRSDRARHGEFGH
mgnify:CR=1 FL=1